MSGITVQITAMHIVEEDALTPFFADTRYDSGIYGDYANAAPGLPNEVADGNGVWLRYGPHSLYEGWLLPPQQTYTNDERWYVPASSYLDRGKRHGLFGRVYKDSDLTQWFAWKDVPTWAEMRNSGDKFRFLNVAGSPSPGAQHNTIYPLMVYWLCNGLVTDHHIDQLNFTLTEVGSAESEWKLGVCTWTGPPADAASKTSEATYEYNDAGGAKTLNFSGAVQAVGFYINWTDASTTANTSDNGWDVTDISVVTSAGTVDLGEAIADLAEVVGIAADHALHTYTDTSVSTLAARPITTVSAAQDAISANSSTPLKWGYEAGGWFDVDDAGDPDATSKTDRARWWSICHADCTYTSDVVDDGEDWYPYVAVVYSALGVTGVDDGMPRVCYRPSTPAATDRVKVLDYSSRYMTTAEAEAVGDQFLAWRAPGSGGRGTINIAGDVRDVDGHVRPAIFIRPGDWIEERERRGHVPWLVTGVSLDATGRIAVSVGGAEREFAALPGLAGIYTDAPLSSAGSDVGANQATVQLPTAPPDVPMQVFGPGYGKPPEEPLPESAPAGEPFPGYSAGLGSPTYVPTGYTTQAEDSATLPEDNPDLWDIW